MTVLLPMELVNKIIGLTYELEHRKSFKETIDLIELFKEHIDAVLNFDTTIPTLNLLLVD